MLTVPRQKAGSHVLLDALPAAPAGAGAILPHRTDWKPIRSFCGQFGQFPAKGAFGCCSCASGKNWLSRPPGVLFLNSEKLDQLPEVAFFSFARNNKLLSLPPPLRKIDMTAPSR